MTDYIWRRSSCVLIAAALCAASACGGQSTPQPATQSTPSTPSPSTEAARSPQQAQTRKLLPREERMKQSPRQQHHSAMPLELFRQPLDLKSLEDIQLEGRGVKLANTLFPANRYADSQCGGVFVGPQVYLTAAHCLGTDPNIQIDGQYNAVCKRDPHYPDSGSAYDFAPCFLKNGVSFSIYETVDLDQTTLKVGDPIMLSGYGKNLQFGYGADLAGETKLKKIDGAVLITDGGAWIKKGDSGSMSVTWSDPAKRRVIAVNSASGAGSEESILASLAASKKFLTKWADDNGVTICGHNRTENDCHP